MNIASVESLRNVAIVGSRGAGKTSLAEALVYTAGAIPVLGSTAHGTTASDFEPEEIHRGISISTSVLRVPWNQHTVTFLDTPGSLSLLGDTLAALRAVDAVILVLSPSTGVRHEAMKLWTHISSLRLPCLIFINESEKDQPALSDLIVACHDHFGIIPIPATLPVGEGASLESVIDLVSESVIRSRPDHPKWQSEPIPEHDRRSVTEAVKALQEAAAETDDALLERYVSAGALEPTETLTGLRHGVHQRTVIPLFRGSAIKNVGMVPLLNAVVSLLPSPQDRAAVAPLSGRAATNGPAVVRAASPDAPFSGLIFKTVIDPFVGRLSYIRVLSGTLHGDTTVFNASRAVKEKCGHLFTLFGKKHAAVASAGAGEIVAIGKLRDAQTGDTLSEERDPILYDWLTLPKPVLAFAIEPKSSADVDKVSLGLHKLIEEDPTLEFSRNPDTKEMVLSGMGQLHLDLSLEKLHRKYGADVAIHLPKIPYRETIRLPAQAQGKYKKQTGGHGQYGDCWLELAPVARGGGFAFDNKIVGGVIPRNFIPAVEKGVIEAMQHGTLAGFPVVDIRVAVYDGSYHVVDSSEMSFKIAASMAFKKAMESAHPVLLEPMMTVDVESSVEHVGAVIGDLNGRRGRILNVEAKGHSETIRALVPLAELMTYTTTLNALTGGGGSYVMELAGYEEVPREIGGKIVEEQKSSKQPVGTH
jgi:elongation factor G